MKTAVVLLLGLSALVSGDTVNLNQAVDELLDSARQVIIQSGKDTIPISDVSEEWKYKWHFIHLKGSFNCHGNGYARALSSLKRTGDVTMTTQGNQITLAASLGLGTLQFGYDHCQAKAEHIISISSKLGLNVRSDSIALQVTLVKNGDKCTSTIDRLELTELGRIDITTGGGEFHKLLDKLLGWMTKHLNDDVKGRVNNALGDAAKTALAGVDLCSKIPF